MACYGVVQHNFRAGNKQHIYNIYIYSIRYEGIPLSMASCVGFAEGSEGHFASFGLIVLKLPMDDLFSDPHFPPLPSFYSFSEAWARQLRTERKIFHV